MSSSVAFRSTSPSPRVEQVGERSDPGIRPAWHPSRPDENKVVAEAGAGPRPPTLVAWLCPHPAPKRSHFSLGGIPVRVEPAFFVIIAILGYNPYRPSVTGVLWWVAIAFVSILVHELGHAVAFRLYGVRPSITLHGMGGLTSGSGELSPVRHIVVSLAGPLSALVLLGIPSWLLAQSGVITSIEGRDAVTAAVWINIGWSLLNLLPILPLDGGQVFAASVDLATKGKPTQAARDRVDRVVAAVLALFALYAGRDLRRADRGHVHRDQRVDAVAGASGSTSEPNCRRRTACCSPTGRPMPSGWPRPCWPSARRATSCAGPASCLAWSRLWQGDLAGAEQAVQRYAHAGQPSSSFRAAQALAAGRTDEGVTLLAWALVNEPAGPAKSLAARRRRRFGPVAGRRPRAELLGAPGAQTPCGCSPSCSATPATTPTPRRSAACSARRSPRTGTATAR